MPDIEVEKLKLELQELLDKIKASQNEADDKSIHDLCADVNDVPKIALKQKRNMRGHISKVSCVQFSSDSRHLLSGALDGKLIIWDTCTGNKVACGGMDNMCTVYNLNSSEVGSGVPKIRRELLGLEGFLSCSCFLDDDVVITGSADMKIVKWDLVKGTRINEFEGHEGDVMSMSLSPDGNSLVTGSVDKTAKLWDVRDGKCKQTFWGHESDVNGVFYHSSGYYFGTGSDDKTARLFDFRADQQIGCYRPPTPNSGFTSCVMSTSGRLIICGSDDFSVHAWDTLKACHKGSLQGHENRVTSISIPANGMALASGSWDFGVRIWN